MKTKKNKLPRIMWADIDNDSKTVPVAVYGTKAEQRGNRPDLKAVPVVVLPLSSVSSMMRDLSQAALVAYARKIKPVNVV